MIHVPGTLLREKMHNFTVKKNSNWQRARKMSIKKPCLCASWEVMCAAPECRQTIHVMGTWETNAYRTPSPWALNSAQKAAGWIFQPARCIAHHTHYVHTEAGIYCPLHAPIQLDYVKRVQAWDREQAAVRKTLWNLIKLVWNGPLDNPPSPPWNAGENK